MHQGRFTSAPQPTASIHRATMGRPDENPPISGRHREFGPGGKPPSGRVRTAGRWAGLVRGSRYDWTTTGLTDVYMLSPVQHVGHPLVLGNRSPGDAAGVYRLNWERRVGQHVCFRFRLQYASRFRVREYIATPPGPASWSHRRRCHLSPTASGQASIRSLPDGSPSRHTRREFSTTDSGYRWAKWFGENVPHNFYFITSVGERVPRGPTGLLRPMITG